MKKFILIISFLFLFGFYFVYQQSKIYILAYEISSYQQKLDKLQRREEVLRCQVLPQMTFAAVDPKFKDLRLSFSAYTYVNIKTGITHPSRSKSLLAKFGFSSQAEARP